MQRDCLAAQAARNGYLRPVAAWLIAVALAVHAAPAHATGAAEAAGVARQAMEYYKASEFSMAAELYRRAFRVDPTRPEYLFGLGRSLQNAGKYQDAVVAYESLLALLPATDPWSKKGRNALRELQATMGALEKTAVHKPEAVRPPEPAPEVPKPVPEPVKVVVEVKPAPVEPPKPVPVVVTHAPPAIPPQVAAPPAVVQAPAEAAPQWQSYARWSLLGVGAVGVLTGAVLLGTGAADRSALDSKLAQTQSGLISGIGYADATAQAQAIGQRKTAGAVVLSVGLAAAAAGGALWFLDTRSSTAWVPMPVPGGVQWVGNF